MTDMFHDGIFVMKLIVNFIFNFSQQLIDFTVHLIKSFSTRIIELPDE